MRSLLHRLQKPSHYAGIEDGVVRKNPDAVNFRIALVFPDTYEVGMSYLGQKILYNILNNHRGWQAERVFLPDLEACALLKNEKLPLATLETATPLNLMDVVGFSITHELCYTDVLHALDLASLTFRSENRPDDFSNFPLIIAGGGAMLGAEPVAPFFDLICLGDGEELLPETLEFFADAKSKGMGRKEFLYQASFIPGIYVPSLFEKMPDGSLKPLRQDYRPARRIVADLNKAVYPVSQVTPVDAVHNRLALEIARGCTRGCRFCHAGIVYRPARERNLENLDTLLNQALIRTGFEEISFLSLSAGDFSGLRSLWNNVWQRCAQEQIGISLPSLRVGSVDDSILEKMAALRRTGCTLAPEAGSQRLRDIINKGITEEELLEHARKLLSHGWRQVKLYFMIGLPGETDADLDAILSICQKTRDAGGKGSPRLAVTAAISPFVPKPFTPFQWEAQIDLDEMRRKINYCRELFQHKKMLTLHWHNPESSYLEGILSRGGRELANVIESAYKKGAVFCGWAEHFALEPWLQALNENGIDPQTLIARRDIEKPLPWDHLECGVSKDFLYREREAAYRGKRTPDCRYGACGKCGACDTKNSTSLLARNNEKEKFTHRLVFPSRDQSDESAKAVTISATQKKPQLAKALMPRQAHYRIWHRKTGNYAYLSQLELQAFIYRNLRRAKLPVAFSQGFHPLPLLSFGRALPVGVESASEWFAITLAAYLVPENLIERLNIFLASDLKIWQVEAVEKKRKTEQAASEVFVLDFENFADFQTGQTAFQVFFNQETFVYEKNTKKATVLMNLRPLLSQWQIIPNRDKIPSISFTANWNSAYLSPLLLMKALFANYGDLQNSRFRLKKTAQIFQDGKTYPPFQNKEQLQLSKS